MSGVVLPLPKEFTNSTYSIRRKAYEAAAGYVRDIHAEFAETYLCYVRHRCAGCGFM